MRQSVYYVRGAKTKCSASSFLYSFAQFFSVLHCCVFKMKQIHTRPSYFVIFFNRGDVYPYYSILSIALGISRNKDVRIFQCISVRETDRQTDRKKKNPFLPVQQQWAGSKCILMLWNERFNITGKYNKSYA